MVEDSVEAAEQIRIALYEKPVRLKPDLYVLGFKLLQDSLNPLAPHQPGFTAGQRGGRSSSDLVYASQDAF